MTPEGVSTGTPKPPDPVPIMTSVQTKQMTITQQQIATIMADYTKQHSAMMARSAAAKADVAAGTEILTPAPERGQWGIWNISDRD